MKYITQLDGLRGIAILSVLMFHLFPTILPGGYVGVSVFFVLSGFLITRILNEDYLKGSIDFPRFWERRIRRILPATVFVSLATLFFSILLLPPPLLKDVGIGIATTLLFISNFFTWTKTGYFAEAAEYKFLIHTWSLAIEEQFYFVFPIILAAVIRYRRWLSPYNFLLFVILISFFISFILGCYFSVHHPAAGFFFPVTRIWELLLGSLVAISEKKLQDYRYLSHFLGLIGVCFIAYSATSYNDHTLVGGFATLVPTLGAAFIIFSSINAPVTSSLIDSRRLFDRTLSFLEYPVLVFLGKISFSAYLIHQPILAMRRVFIDSVHIELYERCLIFIMVIVFSAFSWKFIEQPFRDPKKINKKNLSIFLVFFYPALFLLSLYCFVSGGMVKESERSIYEVPDQYGLLSDKGLRCFDREIGGHCKFPAINQTAYNNVIVIGDSVLDSITPSLKRSLEDQGFGLEVITHPGCFFNGNSELYSQKQGVNFSCNYKRNDLVKYLLSIQPSTIVIGGRLPYYLTGDGFDNEIGGVEAAEKIFLRIKGSQYIEPSRLVASSVIKDIDATINLLIAHKHRIVMIMPFPEMGWHIPKKNSWYYFNHKDIASLSYPHATYLKRISEIETLSYLLKNKVHLIDPAIMLCPSVPKEDTRVCLALLGKEALYSDSVHLSQKGGEIFVKQLFDSSFLDKY